jgi:hypothetical protein
MTSNLMDTEKGGEQTQYEGEHSDMMPHKQEAGQLGGTYPYNLLPLTYTITFPSCNPLLPFSSPTNTDVSTASAVQGGSTTQPTSSREIEQDNKKTDEPNTVGISKADKIRYGQSIQEGGMGGKTGAEGGLAAGGADEPTAEGDAGEQRRQQGYGGEADMRRDVGA